MNARAPEAGCNCEHLDETATCVWCSNTAGEGDSILLTDGSGCFYCEGNTDYHPTCDHPGCDEATHGRGPEGKTVKSYCEDCREGAAIATDGGLSPEDLRKVNTVLEAEVEFHRARAEFMETVVEKLLSPEIADEIVEGGVA